jgi:LysR family transcriptional regulator, nitrogen assimilation regulatory protein
MNLRQLKYFVKVVEAGNMTRAAETLYVAQPALGMQIRQLEEDLGVALLVRHSRGVEPTPAGALLHARALEILKLVEESRREVSARGQESSEAIRLGLTPMLMLVLGPEVVINVRERLPQVFLSLVEEMSHVLVDALSRGEIDLALAYDVPDVPHLERTALLHEDLVLVTLPGVRKGQPIAFAEAMEESLVLPESRDAVRELVIRTARELGLEPKIAFEVRSIPVIKNLILRGAAAGILPYGTVFEEVRSGKLDARAITAPPLRRTLYLASSSKRAPFKNELALTGVIRASLSCLTDLVGSLAHPVLPSESGEPSVS